MRYVMARYVEYQREMAYRYYMSDCLNLINQNKYLAERYADTLKSEWRPTSNKSGEEIAQEVIAKAGLVVKK